MTSDAWMGLILKDSAARSAAEDPPLECVMDERRHAARRGEDEDRYLSNADVKAIAMELKEAFLKDFYTDLGKGTWAVLWRVAATLLGGIAAYGQLKSWGVFK